MHPVKQILHRRIARAWTDASSAVTSASAARASQAILLILGVLSFTGHLHNG
jgi:hypothetical protein